MHIFINQSNVENNVPDSVINKLNKICKDTNFLEELINNNSSFIGNINVDYTYDKYITNINTYFQSLIINAQNLYLMFEDTYVLNKLLANGYGNGEGITTEAASTIIFNQLFLEDSNIKSFNEFSYFTRQQSNNCTFQNCSNLYSIDLSNLTGVPMQRMFFGCTKLTNINYLGNITKTSPYMFYNCSSLTSINIPTTVTEVSKGCFQGCVNLNIHIDDLYNITTFDGNRDSGPFGNGDASTTCKIIGSDTLYLPNAISVKDRAFNGQDFKYINLPNLTTLSGQATFNGMSNLIEVISLGNNITQLTGDFDYGSKGMFGGCTKLEKVTLPQNLTNLTENMFSGCVKLSDLNLNIIRNNIVSVGYGAFSECNLLPRVFYFKNCTDFRGVYKLTNRQSFYLPKNKSTKKSNGYYWNHELNATSWSYRGSGCILNTIYYKDIESFEAGTFVCIDVYNIIINNVIPPSLITNSTLDSAVAEDGITDYNTHIFAGITKSNTNIQNIYVPDSAVETYKQNTLYANIVDLIKPLSTCPRITIQEGNEGINGVIEEYMS